MAFMLLDLYIVKLLTMLLDCWNSHSYSNKACSASLNVLFFNMADEKDKFPLVLVGGVLEGNKKWDISGEVIKCISKVFPGTVPIWPEVCMFVTMPF